LMVACHRFLAPADRLLPLGELRVRIADEQLIDIQASILGVEPHRLVEKTEGFGGAPMRDHVVGFLAVGPRQIAVERHRLIGLRKPKVVAVGRLCDNALKEVSVGIIGLKGDGAIELRFDLLDHLVKVLLSDPVVEKPGGFYGRLSGKRFLIVRVELQSLFEIVDGFGDIVRRQSYSPPQRVAPHRVIGRVRVRRPPADRAQSLGVDELGAERIADARDRLGLQFAEFGALAFEPVGPNMRAGLGRDELSVDRDRLADPPDAAFERVSNSEIAPDLLEIDGLPLIGRSGRAADHEGVLDIGKVSRQIIGQTVSEVVLLRIAAEVGERKHDDRQTRGTGEFVVCHRGDRNGHPRRQ
jgi:hypothetical protein